MADSATSINEYIEALPPWQRDLVARIRKLIHAADPGMAEAWKWSTPVFVHGGNLCAVGAFADHVKVNFFNGASLDDPHGLFNAGLEAKSSRAIDLRQGDKLNEAAFEALIRSAAGAASSRTRMQGRVAERQTRRP
jgi:hypothetical protein